MAPCFVLHPDHPTPDSASHSPHFGESSVDIPDGNYGVREASTRPSLSQGARGPETFSQSSLSGESTQVQAFGSLHGELGLVEPFDVLGTSLPT